MDNNIISILSLTIQTLLLCIQVPTLVALIVYVWETKKMASATKKSVEVAEKSLYEMREQRDAEIAPYIIAYLDAPGHINRSLYLVIKNTGKTVAKNVKIIFDPPLQTQYPELLQRILPPDGIPSIPPDYEIRTVIDSFQSYKNSGPMAFAVVVTYYGGISDKPREDKYYLDLMLFRGTVSSKEIEPPSDTAKALQKIQSSIEMIVAELQKMSDTISQNYESKIASNRKPTTKKPT